MALLQIEGDIKGVSKRQLQFIQDVLHERGFKDNKVIFEPVGEAGDNYLANVKRISVKVDGESDFKIIAKFAPQIESVRISMSSDKMFRNETLMYQELLPKLVGLQVANNVPDNERFKYAKCYGCLSEEPNEVILLEDLKLLDMKMFDRFKPLSYQAVKLIIKNFAKLHALAFVLKKRKPDVFNRFKNVLVNAWEASSTSPEFHLYLSQIEDHALSILDDEEYKKVLRGVVSQMGFLVNEMKKSDEHSEHLVFIHGDAWTNNIMFKCEDEKPVECINIDYQVSNAANPVRDILYMIFACTDHVSRLKYFHDWIEYYHDELDQVLLSFGIQAKCVYPKEQLDADLKRYSKIQIGVSLLLYSVLSRNAEEAALVKDAISTENAEAEENSALEKLSDATVSFYKSRIVDLVDSYRYLGYI